MTVGTSSSEPQPSRSGIYPRGGEQKIALNVVGRFEADHAWLDDGSEAEWTVSYHGSGRCHGTMAEDGFSANKGVEGMYSARTPILRSLSQRGSSTRLLGTRWWSKTA